MWLSRSNPPRALRYNDYRDRENHVESPCAVSAPQNPRQLINPPPPRDRLPATHSKILRCCRTHASVRKRPLPERFRVQGRTARRRSTRNAGDACVHIFISAKNIKTFCFHISTSILYTNFAILFVCASRTLSVNIRRLIYNIQLRQLFEF